MNSEQFIRKYIVCDSVEPAIYSLGIGSSHYYGFQIACKKYGLVFERFGDYYFLSEPSGAVLGVVKDMKSNHVALTANNICNNKQATNEILKRSGHPVPKQMRLVDRGVASPDDIDFYPVVLKPIDGKGGKSVYLNCKNREDIEVILNKYRNVKTGKLSGDWIVEEYVTGFDVRVTVVGNKFDCACVRVPPFVVGDGVSSIEQLIRKKNVIRGKHPHHKRFPIDVDKFGSDRILNQGEIVVLSNVSNIHQGAEAFDVTDLICGDLKRLAESAVRAVPGLNNAGIDLMVFGLDSAENAKIIEINTSSNYEIHYFPFYGEHRNPADRLVRMMLG